MGIERTYDFGKTCKVIPAIAPVTQNSSAAAAITGLTIDRQALQRQYYSCRTAVTGRLAGSTQQVATIANAFQHSSDGTSWDSYSTDTNQSGTIGSTGATGAQSTDGVAEQVVNLSSARRYIRVMPTPSFSLTTSGDTLAVNGVVVFGGADELPTS